MAVAVPDGIMPETVRTRNALVVTQVALSLVLLMAAGLLLKSFVALRRVDPGFEPRNVLSLRVVVCTLLAAVGAVACFLPARRAAKVGPIEALRHE